MEQTDWNESRTIINKIVKDKINKDLKQDFPRCIFCGNTEKITYLKYIDDLVCEECRKRILE